MSNKQCTTGIIFETNLLHSLIIMHIVSKIESWKIKPTESR